MKIAELHAPEKNVRVHTEAQIKEFEKSIRMFGQLRPIVVDETNTILAGNGLCVTLQRMGIEDMYGTVTHNRARGEHLLEPMKNIVQKLISQGKSVEEIGKQLGMKPEEIFRLSNFSKEDFLRMMVDGTEQYSKAEIITKM